MVRLKLGLGALVLAGGLLAGTGCATTAPLAATSLNPASEGRVVARAGPNGNTKLRITLDHLPEPSLLAPSLSTYVAWVRPAGSVDYVNVGRIFIDDERRGKLDTTTPYQELDVLVTAETSAQVERPSRHVMLRGGVDREQNFVERIATLNR